VHIIAWLPGLVRREPALISLGACVGREAVSGVPSFPWIEGSPELHAWIVRVIRFDQGSTESRPTTN